MGERRWMVPILTVAALVLIWLAVPRRSGRERSPEAHIPAAVATEGGEVTGATAAERAGFEKRSLPNGVELDIPYVGLEAKLIAFVQDPVRHVDDSTWMTFDRIRFVPRSARLSHESDEQLHNIAAVLNAYPNVKVKVGGYTDDAGAAKSNLWLSQRRADAVKAALVKRGIAANRMQAEGYGGRDPVADNATSQGRGQNRRIAILVTAK